MRILNEPPGATAVFYEVAEVGLHYVRADLSNFIRPKISSSSDAERILRPFFESAMHHRELFYMLCLSNSNEVLAAYRVSEGGLTGTVADVRLIYQTALLCNATALIICHNHPSGNTSPSQADISLTRKVKQAGEILDIRLLDHLILTATAYKSFGDEGLL